MNVKVITTDGSGPIGSGIGPVLEAEDVMSILRNDPMAPEDLREKSLEMASKMLHMTGKYSKRIARKTALEMLESGAALKKMKEIIKAQGRQKKVPLGTHRFEIVSSKTGKVQKIDNEVIAKIARIAGAPQDKGSGMYLNKKVGDKVLKKELLYTIYAESKTKMDLVKEYLKISRGYTIS